MADPIYGLQQSQPRDVYDYMRANAKKLNLVGRFSYLPLLKQKAEIGLVGLNDGLEFIISDSVRYIDQKLMDGRTRRYAIIRAYSLAYGTYSEPESAEVLTEIKRLGYEELDVLQQLTTPAAISLSLGIPISAFGSSILSHADFVEFRAGAPTYRDEETTVADAPHDGNPYSRVDGEWIQSVGIGDIDGGIATLL